MDVGKAFRLCSFFFPVNILSPIGVLVLIVSGSMALVDPQGEPRHMRSIEENG